MAFWSSWFAPACDRCGEKIVGVEPVVVEKEKRCSSCHEKVLAEEAKEQAEVEARRQAEENARAKLEGDRRFGTDPRYQE